MEEERNTVTEQAANEKPESAQEGTKSEAETKTFTQADIDKIVSERLKAVNADKSVLSGIE